MTVEELKELLDEYPDDYTVRVNIYDFEEAWESNATYDIIDIIDNDSIMGTIYLVAE